MASVKIVIGASMIVIGVLLLVISAYYLFAFEKRYFVAEGVSIEPGRKRAVLVVPDSKIVITNFRAPFCEGGRLVLYDNHGNVVWESAGGRAGGEDVIPVTSCFSGECTYYMEAVAPPDCTVEKYGANALGSYTLYVYYKPRELRGPASTMLILGLILIVAGAYTVKKRPGKTIGIDDALIELAKKRPLPPTPGETVVMELTLKPKGGLRDKDVSKLIDIVAEKKSVRIEANRPRFKDEYSISITGARENATEAMRDLAWFCQATGKCEVALKKL